MDREQSMSINMIKDTGSWLSGEKTVIGIGVDSPEQKNYAELA